MGDQNSSTNFQPLAAAGFYLLDLNSTSGLPESVPLQLILSEIGRSGQYVLPSLPAQHSETIAHSSNLEPLNRDSVNNAISSEQIPQATTKLSKVNMISNVRIDPDTNKTKKHSKDIRSDMKENYANTKDVKLTNGIENYIHIPDKPLLPRALAVLPKALQMVNGSIYPVQSLPPRTRFGPVKGISKKLYLSEADELIKDATSNKTPIFLVRNDEFSVTHINVTDKERSNWLSLLPLGKKSTANVWLYEDDNELYGITTGIITTKMPLALGYSRRYADDHNLVAEPVIDLEHALSEQPLWWCMECRRDLGSSTSLQKHIRVSHSEKSMSQRKLRCPFCFQGFSRLFSLRRHKKFCRKKPEPGQLTPNTPDTSIEKSSISRAEPELLTAPSIEETKTPSDESFQNYTNALEFSINLFDPDRISNLDMSGSSKSEHEFNDNLDNNEEYTKFCKGLKDKTKATFEEPPIMLTCSYCKQTMTKVTKRRHLKECPARRLECECGKKFTKKEDFAKHVYFDHNTIFGTGNVKKKGADETNTKSVTYQCDACKVKFKRRGMLVNHLWRVHKTKSIDVPLERRIRHYPCSVCPKIYRTAAKRNRHVEVHHPGALIRAAPIEGERRLLQPARCTACPREYVTKAKLLQHMRALHPLLVASIKPEPKPPKKKTPRRKPPPRKEPTLGFY